MDYEADVLVLISCCLIIHSDSDLHGPMVSRLPVEN
jgi:hypothetical protein